METTNFAFFAHPRSGEVYACRYKVDTQRIIDAAGPVHHSEHDRFERVGDQPSEAESERCREILSNAFVTAETGKWLDREIWDDR